MKKILIADDEQDILLVLSKLLITNGFEVETAKDAYQCIKLAQEVKPDLIILDLNMPAGGGKGALDNLLMSSKTLAIPILILTAIKDDELKTELLAKGATAFENKPYNSELLLTKIKEILKV